MTEAKKTTTTLGGKEHIFFCQEMLGTARGVPKSYDEDCR